MTEVECCTISLTARPSRLMQTSSGGVKLGKSGIPTFPWSFTCFWESTSLDTSSQMEFLDPIFRTWYFYEYGENESSSKAFRLWPHIDSHSFDDKQMFQKKYHYQIIISHPLNAIPPTPIYSLRLKSKSIMPSLNSCLAPFQQACWTSS